MAATTLSLSPHCNFAGSSKVAGRASAHSRSTSAGSAPSDSQGSVDLQRLLQDSPSVSVYSTDSLELPEYDYPSPWAVQSVPNLPEIDYPAPLVVKNTFVGFNVLRTPSLEEFYEERKTQSCPASGIGLPPGLEDLVEPKEAAAKLVEAEVALHQKAFHEAMVSNDFVWPTEHLLPSGLLDVPHEPETLETQQFVPSPLPPQHPSAFGAASQHTAAFDVPWQMAAASLAFQHAPRQPVVLDLAGALDSPIEAMQPQAREPEIGSPECPTVGSQGHWFGACKPCAFLYTKGCGNGAFCEFCHLCDAGEKKKRAKEKRAAFRSAKQMGC